MRRVLFALLAGAVAVGALVGVASAGDPRTPRQQTLVIYSKELKFKSFDVGKAGPSAGDGFVSYDTLFDDAALTHAVGIDRVLCNNLVSPYIMCTDEFTITGQGKLVTAGTLNFGNHFEAAGDDLAITGGTGLFVSARGAVHLEVFNADTFKNTIEIEP